MQYEFLQENLIIYFESFTSYFTISTQLNLFMKMSHNFLVQLKLERLCLNF